MTSTSDTALVAGPRTAEWDFGDFAYGLEPLAMPPVGHATVSSARVPSFLPPCDSNLVLSRLRLLAGGEAPVDPDPRVGVTDEQLFWFRWITGHQISFLIWRSMGEILERSAKGEIQDSASLARLERYAYGYSAMLLYTGSCPIDLYQSLIRPRMYLQHRGFSGTWASDFVPVRGLFRGQGTAVRGNTPEAARLARAVNIHKTIHDGVAARLVPGGQSLLQQSMRETVVRPSERTAVLYDNFFLTLRAPVDGYGITSQLLRRLQAVAWDLSRQGLYPRGHGGDRPEELRSAEVAHCENRIGYILHEVGEAAVTPAQLS
ncbi:hypothetical protein ACH4D3_32440 [Streptomyces sp. NPDC018026]|uniref:hypothetical protein n=1 Tax=Streptomyces sp. NPDC018026 TaxID=3365031 RepID=UPI00378E0859